jgi:hypothetical protein
MREVNVLGSRLLPRVVIGADVEGRTQLLLVTRIMRLPSPAPVLLSCLKLTLLAAAHRATGWPVFDAAEVVVVQTVAVRFLCDVLFLTDYRLLVIGALPA